jgi:hypothetical protein
MVALPFVSASLFEDPHLFRIHESYCHAKLTSIFKF